MMSHLVAQRPALFSVEELRRLLNRDADGFEALDSVRVALDELSGDGLVHRIGNFDFATYAAGPIGPVAALSTTGGATWRTVADTHGIRSLRLARAGDGHTRTPGTITLRFRDLPSVEDELKQLVSAERTCCAFLGWTLDRDGDR